MKIDKPTTGKIHEILKYEGQSLKAGQTIQARIIEAIGENIILLQDNNGNMLEARGSIPFKGEMDYLTFTITDIRDKTIFIKLIEDTEVKKDKDLISNLLTNLGLKATKENTEIVKNLIDNELPATKENINIIKMMSMALEKSMELNKLGIEFSDLNLKDMNILEVLREGLKSDKFQNPGLKGNEELKSLKGTDLQKIIYLVKNNMTFSTSSLEHINNILLRDFSITDQILNILNEKKVGKNETDVIVNLEELRSKAFQLKEMILDRKIDFDFATKTLYDKISTIVQDGEIGDKLNLKIENLRRSLEFINKINENQIFFQLPIGLKNDLKNLELYVMKKSKKKNEKNLKDGIRIFLSLDTNTFDKVQILIDLSNRNLSVDFFTTNEKIRSELYNSSDGLKDRISQFGFKDICLNFVLSKKEINLINSETEYKSNRLNSLDIRV